MRIRLLFALLAATALCSILTLVSGPDVRAAQRDLDCGDFPNQAASFAFVAPSDATLPEPRHHRPRSRRRCCLHEPPAAAGDT